MRAPEKQITIILRQFVIRRVVECASRTVVSTKMTKTATGVPVLWKPFLRVLIVLLLVRYRDHADASLGADPRADSATSAFLHVE